MNTQATEDWNDGDFDFQDGDGISSSILNLDPQQHPDLDPESESDDQENDEQQFILSEQGSSDLELELQLNAFDDDDQDQEEDEDTHSNHLKGVDVNERRGGEGGGPSSQEMMPSDWDLDQDDDEDQVDTIKLSSLAGETLESLRLASNLSKTKASSTTTSSTHPSNLINHSQFTGTITQLNSRPSRNQRVDMQGGGDWDEDLEIPDFLPSLSSKRTSRDGPLDDSKDSNRPRSFTSELELDISDQEEEGEGSSSKSNRNQNRNSSTSLSEDSNQSLNSLGNIRRNVYSLHQHSNYTSTDWTTDSPSPESNNHRLQGGRINHGGKDFKNRLSSSSISSNNSSRPSHEIPMTPEKSTSTKPPIIMSSSDSNSKRQHPSLSISMWQKDSEEMDLENDFELPSQLSRLDLNPTIIRQKSFNTLDKERVLWNEVSGSSGSLSSSPEVGGSLDRRKIKGKSSSKGFSASASTSEFDEPNEGEDREEEEENEDLLEGLIFPESVFGPADNEDQKEKPVLDRDGDEADGENDNENSNLMMKNKNKKKTKRKPPITNSNHNAREKLQAMLDARSKGIQLAPRLSSDDLKSNLLKRRNLDRRFSDDDDHDFGKGLVITDDLELSPSRLKANGFSFKFKNHNNSSSSSSGTNVRGGSSSRRGGNVTSSSTSKYGNAIGSGRSNFNTGIGIGPQPSISGIGKIARNRNPARAPSSSMTTRNPSNQFRKVTPTPTSTFVPPSSSSSSSTPFNTSSSPIPNANQGQSSTPSTLPSVRVTNPSSSPNHFSHHQSHLSSDSARSSPPRAPSAYSHFPGLGPRQQQLQRESRALRGEKSVGNLGLLSRTSNHPSPSSSALQTQNQGPSRQTIDNNAPVVQNANLLRTRPKPLSRKRSLPTLSVENDDVTPQPSQLVFNNPSSSGVDSGNLTTLSKSKSGSTESVNQISTYESIRPKFNEQYPPSRPNTPTGPMRYAVPTASSLARRTAQTSPTNQVPISHNKVVRRTNQSLGSIDSVAAAARGMRRQKSRHYGDGHELDGFDDLPVNTNDSAGFRSPPIGSALSIGCGDQSGSGSITPSWRRNASPLTGGNDLNSNLRMGDETIKSRSALMSKNNPFLTTSPPSQFKSRRSKLATSSSKTKRPTLISSLNRDSSNSKISGIPTGSNDMKWNSTKQKWEGNENDLKIFEQVLNSSSIPALISSSTGLMTKGKSIGIGGGGGGNGKIVGDMIFDQIKMCWLPKPGGIEEPDVFELMDLDDEDEMESSQHHESTRSRSNTPGFGSDLIDSERVKKTRPRASTETSSMISQDDKFNDEEGEEEEVDFDFEDEEETIQDQLALTTKLISSQDQGVGGGELGLVIDEGLKKQCLEAERRHRLELKGFLTPTRSSNSNSAKNHPSKRTSSSRPQPQSSSTLDRTIEDEQRDMDRLLNRRNKDLWFIRKSFGNFKHK